MNIAAGDVAGLIQAIDNANFIAQPNVINLAAGATYVLTAPDNATGGPNGLPVFLSNITINGNGAIIERSGSTPFRILSVADGANVVLSNLTIEQGSSDSGGGINNAGTLALMDDVLKGNSATGNGGAVFNSGSLTTPGTTFSNNSAGGSGPDIFKAEVPTATTTTLTDNGLNPSTFGQAVSFTVNVAGGAPDGEGVTLEDADNNNAVVGAGTLAGGTATIAVTGLVGGTDDIFAVYGGDPNFSGSQSSTVSQTVNQAPSFTSDTQATFNVGAADSFTVAAGGYAAPTLSENAGDVLPSGVTFDPTTGTLSGTPALGTVGTYTLNFTADNGIGSDATQTLTLVVGQATPAITWNVNPITYGTPLDSTDFDASANVAGTFVYEQSVGAVLPAVSTPMLVATFTPADTADYASVTQAVPLEVDPAPLNVYADPQSSPYGSALPPLTFTASGFVNGDTAASLPGALATTATSSSPAGSYGITAGTLGIFDMSLNAKDSNYDITYFGANLTIDAGPAVQLVPTTEPPGQVVLGQSFQVVVWAEDANNNLNTTFNGTATITLLGGPTGVLGGTLMEPFTNGVAAFSDLTLNALGTSDMLQVTTNGLTPATTTAVNVIAAPSVPSPPQLAPQSDTGVSHADGLTQDNARRALRSCSTSRA